MPCCHPTIRGNTPPIRRLQWLGLAMMGLGALFLGTAVALAAITHFASITIQNSTTTAHTGQVLQLPFSGAGLGDYTADLRFIHIDDTPGVAQVVEARSDTSNWRIAVPDVAASSGTTYTLEVEDSTLIDAFGCSCWASVAYDANMAPSGDLDITAEVVVDDPWPYTPHDPSITTVARQYPSTRRVASIGDTTYIAYITADGASWDVRVTASNDKGLTWINTGGFDFDGDDVPVAVALASSGDLAYLFLAVATHDTVAAPDEQDFYIGRGEIGEITTNVRWAGGDGTGTTMTAIATGLADADDGLLVHGLSITNTVTNDNPTVTGVYNDGTDAILSRWRSTGSNTWATPNQTTRNPAAGELITRVECGTWDAVTEVFCITKVGEWAGENLLAFAVGDATWTAEGTPNASTNRHNFSLFTTSTPYAYLVYSNEAAAGNATVAYEEYDNAAWNVNASTLSTDAIRPTLTHASTYVSTDPGAALIVYADSHALSADPGLVYRMWTLRDSISWSSLQTLIDAGNAQPISPASPRSITDWDDEALIIQDTWDEDLDFLVPRAFRSFVVMKQQSYGLFVGDGIAQAEVYTDNAGGTLYRSSTVVVTDGRHTLQYQFNNPADNNVRVRVDGGSWGSAATAGNVDNNVAERLELSYGIPGTMDISMDFDGSAGVDARYYSAFATADAGLTYTSADIQGFLLTATVERFHGTDSPSGVTIASSALTPEGGFAQTTTRTTESTPTPAFSSAPDAPTGLFDDTGSLTFPFGDVIEDAANASSIPLGLLAMTFALALSTGLAFAAYFYTHSLFFSAMAMDLGLWAMALMTPMAVWVPIVGLIAVLGTVVMQRQTQV